MDQISDPLRLFHPVDYIYTFELYLFTK